MRRTILSLIFFVALLFAWHAVVTYEVSKKAWSPVLAVPPLEVGRYLVSAIKDGSLAEGALVTMRRLPLASKPVTSPQVTSTPNSRICSSKAVAMSLPVMDLIAG